MTVIHFIFHIWKYHQFFISCFALVLQTPSQWQLLTLTNCDLWPALFWKSSTSSSVNIDPCAVSRWAGDLWMRYVWTCSDTQVINKWSGTIYRFDYIVGLIASYQLQLNKNTSTVSVYTLIWVHGCYGYSGCNNISSVFVSTYLLILKTYYVFILFYIVSCTVQQRVVTC